MSAEQDELTAELAAVVARVSEVIRVLTAERDAWRATAEGWERTAHLLAAQVASAHVAVHAASSVTLEAARISAAVGP